MRATQLVFSVRRWFLQRSPRLIHATRFAANVALNAAISLSPLTSWGDQVRVGMESDFGLISGPILAATGSANLASHDRNAAMISLDAMGVSARTRRADVATGDLASYRTNFTEATLDWDMFIPPSPNLGSTVTLQLGIGVNGGLRELSDASGPFMDATWTFEVFLDEQLASQTDTFTQGIPLLSTTPFEVPVGSPFRLGHRLTASTFVRESLFPLLFDPVPETYDAFGGYDFTAVMRTVRFFDQGAPIEVPYTVNGGLAPLSAVPPTLGDQLTELTRRSIRGEIPPTFAGNTILTLTGDEALEPLVANLPFPVVAEVESRLPDLRREEISDLLQSGSIDMDEYHRRQRNANEISELLQSVKQQRSYAEFLRDEQPTEAAMLVYGFIQLFFGADPYYGLYTPDQPISLPLPNPATYTFSAGPQTAGVTLRLPRLWGGGSRSPDVLGSQFTIRHENGQLEVIGFSTEMASFDILQDQATGLNQGALLPGGQVWSQFDPLSGTVVARGEGHVTNDLYPADRPIFVFPDINGRLLSVNNETLVEATIDNEPMIVPGLPGQVPALQPVAFAATRASFDAATGQLQLHENTDTTLAPDISVVLTPDDVFGHGLDNAAEPLIGAQVIVDSMTLLGPVTEGDPILFSDTLFEISNTSGVFASGQFTNIRIDRDLMSLLADVVFDAGNSLASPFISDWQSDPGTAVLLGRIGTLDLLALTDDLTRSGSSPTDFMTLTRQVVLRGDFNNDHLWNCADVDALTQAIVNGSTDLQFDMNGDGMVTAADLTDPILGWLAVGGEQNPSATGRNAFLPGDANLDGRVDGYDFLTWNTAKFSAETGWCRGDFNADGSIDGADFLIWNEHKFQPSSFAVPEPSVLLWLFMALGLTPTAAAWRHRSRAAYMA